MQDVSHGVIRNQWKINTIICQLINRSKIHSKFYDNQSKVKFLFRNFFDNITTATTMRPPAQPKYRYPYNSSTKMGSCGNERLNSYPINNSSGSLSMNETKSSYDESMDRTASTEFSEFDIKNHEKRDDVCNEPEPEWFSTPASRHDVIDLHGFEDDEGYRGHSSDDMMMMGKNPRQNYHQKQQKNCNYNGGRANYHHQQQQQQQQQRYRQSSK